MLNGDGKALKGTGVVLKGDEEALGAMKKN